MRLILEIAGVAVLLFLGWERPFQRWVHPFPNEIPKAAITAMKIEPSVTPAPSVELSPNPAPGSWMWDKQRTNPLDRGPYNRNDNVARAPQFYRPTQTGHLVDENGRRYWIDQNGVRHYF